MTTNKAIPKVNGIKAGKLKTGSPKYSSNLYEKPIGSLSLINPEMMNKIPTKILEKCTMYFIN